MTGRNLKACLERVRNEGCPDDDQERMAHHLVIPGNRPSNTLLMHQVSPTTLGALIALYEHKVFVQSVMWNINAFDQWGVELGKELSDTLYPLLSDESCTVQADPATLELARIFREHRNGKTDPLGENN
jgi:glucose-6-phosphate isomerase